MGTVRRLNGMLLVGCVVAAAFFAPEASAASGRITFSGAILAPTCALTSQDAMADLAEEPAQPRGCASTGTTADGAPTRYTLAVTTLTRLVMDDRLRRYFTDFVAVDDAPAQTPLVVQTYL